MEIIVTSKRLGTFFDDDGGYDVYAEVCRLPHIGWMEYTARLVECPEGYPDKMLQVSKGMRSEREAADKLANMIVGYRRSSGLF